jgi:hypothetical protein
MKSMIVLIFCTALSAQTVTINGVANQKLVAPPRGLSFIFAPGAAITTGATIYLTVPFSCTIKEWSIDSTTAETVTVKLWRVATGGTAIPTVSNSISTSGVSLSSGTHVRSSTVSDFTSVAIAAGDTLAANVTAVTASQFVNYTLWCQQ